MLLSVQWIYANDDVPNLNIHRPSCLLRGCYWDTDVQHWPRQFSVSLVSRDGSLKRSNWSRKRRRFWFLSRGPLDFEFCPACLKMQKDWASAGACQIVWGNLSSGRPSHLPHSWRRVQVITWLRTDFIYVIRFMDTTKVRRSPTIFLYFLL